MQAVRVRQVVLEYTSQLTGAHWLQLHLDSFETAQQVLPPTSLRLQQCSALRHDTSTAILPVPSPRVVDVFGLRADPHPVQLPQQLELPTELLVRGLREQAAIRQGQETAKGLRELVRVRSTSTPPLLLNCTRITNHHHLPRTLRPITYTHRDSFTLFWTKESPRHFAHFSTLFSPTRLGHERTHNSTHFVTCCTKALHLELSIFIFIFRKSYSGFSARGSPSSLLLFHTHQRAYYGKKGAFWAQGYQLCCVVVP